MLRMAKSTVFLSGLGGLGVEIAKNIALAGVKSLVLHDTVGATLSDLASQFFLTQDDVAHNVNRAVASMPRVAELNPYVTVDKRTDSLDGDISFLGAYQCVILTEASLDLQIKVDQFCRTHTPPIPFIAGDVRGVFTSLFVDAGPNFEVHDSTGEEPKEVLVGSITKAADGVVAMLEGRRHDLEDGDHVEFREVQGMVELNGHVRRIKTIDQHSFSIGDTSTLTAHVRGGIGRQLHRKITVTHKPLSEQLQHPEYLFVDSKKGSSVLTMLGFVALDLFRKQHARFPAPWNKEDAAAFIAIAKEYNDRSPEKVEINEDVLRVFSYTCSGVVCGLTSSLGGIAAQETLKVLTGKFTPLTQFLFTDCIEIVPPVASDPSPFSPTGDRYDTQRICIGNALQEKLTHTRLFMVGCGAIGCELIKNFALMGVSTADGVVSTITDNDLIEKSNLNRQFLFRPHHIQQPKSVTAASAAAGINPAIHINALQHKVGVETQTDIFTDEFFLGQNVIVNALDNVEARRYVDSRCVTNQRPLLESGTLGTKGHVQVVVPFLTESYGSVSDPPEPDIPFCTLKSFPANIEHTTQWAREKFGSLYDIKPAAFNKFWADNGGYEATIAALRSGEQSKTLARVGLIRRIVGHRPKCWADCVALGRIKFEKYFNHKAQQLLSSFPPETLLSDGSPFWQPPKRQPMPLVFDASDPLHMLFVESAAALFARVYGIAIPADEEMTKHLAHVVVPPFVSKSKKIVTDESVKRDATTAPVAEDEDLPAVAAYLQHECDGAMANGLAPIPTLVPELFEKDDDSNHHIDFISAAANLRARMYSIPAMDRLAIKRIAGKIVPAIATTTSAVSGLVSIELIKIVLGVPLAMYSNVFMNLALPLLIPGEPAAVPSEAIGENQSFTLWDRWEIRGNETTTLAQFLTALTEKYHVTPTAVFHGAAMVYVPSLMGQEKKLTKAMRKLIKSKSGAYADLVVTVTYNQEDVAGPPVRYYF